MTLEDNKAVVQKLWLAVYGRDWEGLAAVLTDDCWHQDVPAPDANAGARGAQNIVDRMRIGFDLSDRFEHEVKSLVAEGDFVVVEHVERWHFHTREIVENKLLTIHELRDGKVARWSDYWDIQSMISQAPQWWIEKIAEASPQDFS